MLAEVTVNTRQDVPGPAFWDPGTPPYRDDAGMVHVFGYAAAMEVLTTTVRDFSYMRRHPNWDFMWGQNGDRHDWLKGIVTAPMSVRGLDRAGISGVIQDVTAVLIGQILDSGTGRFEVMADLARPLARQVICHLMGLPVADDTRLTDWVDEFTRAPFSNTPGQPDMVAYFRQLLNERRAQPLLGLTGHLLAAQADPACRLNGQGLTDDDLIAYHWGIMAAAYETTATALGNALILLADNNLLPDLRRWPGLIPGAIEEFLRWWPPFPFDTGLATEKTHITVDGKPVQPGEPVTASLPAANRDPSVFDQPGRLDILRNPNPHLSFAFGKHHCLGAPLARIELATALSMIIDRLGDVRRDQETEPDCTMGVVHRVNSAHFTYG